MVIQLKRAYAPPESDDGFRVLVDRLWPRGVSKRAARIDLWLKEIAPSAALWQWCGHDPAKWSTFRARYVRELQPNGAAVEQLRAHVRQGRDGMRVEAVDSPSLLELRALVAQRLQAYGAFEGCAAEERGTILAQACLVIWHLTAGQEGRRLYRIHLASPANGVPPRRCSTP